MFYTVLLVILLANSALTKPRYADLSEDEQQLFRAAYDTPSYDQNELEEEDDMHLGKLDLLKDGLWAVKAKLKELKAFNKALAANLLSTKLKVKELLANQLRLKNHHHHDVPEKTYPVHNYQPQPYPSYEAQVPQYGVPQYGHDPYYGH